MFLEISSISVSELQISSKIQVKFRSYIELRGTDLKRLRIILHQHSIVHHVRSFCSVFGLGLKLSGPK